MYIQASRASNIYSFFLKKMSTFGSICREMMYFKVSFSFLSGINIMSCCSHNCLMFMYIFRCSHPSHSLQFLLTRNLPQMNMDDQLTVFSQNCRGGLSVANKRRDLFHYVRNKNIILFVFKMYM